MNKPVKRLCICAMFTALIFVITVFVSVPAGPVGNINLGDAFIIIATFVLGPYGAIAGGVGAMLADLISAYAIYAPATLVIKSLLAIACYYVYKVFKRIIRFDYISRLIGAICGELVMVIGYFLYEGILYGFANALISVPFNLIQGVTAVTLGTIVSFLLLKNKTVNGFIEGLKG
ncbi:MAG: ECF transporter S component [Clostridia bacterium]|nr:ECF transporter S component [Clostridia bacterium]